MKKGIYLREGDEYVGPFFSRGDAERFLTLMELFGGNSQGIEIVENALQEQSDFEEGPVDERGYVLTEAPRYRKQ